MPLSAVDSELERHWLSLLRRVLASPQFVHAESLQRILLFLYEQARSDNAPPVKEYQIAVEAIKRPLSFDPKLDAIVRVSIASIRERLHAYFDNEGRKERWSLEIPKGKYCLRFAETLGSDRDRETEVNHAALRRFWAPYVTSSHPNAVLYTELLCFGDTKGNYFRSIYVNDPAEGHELARRHLPDAPGDVLPSYHFVSGGEMRGVLSLTQAFHEMHCTAEVKNSRFVSWVDVQGANLVVLGSARTNRFVRQLQSGEKLVIQDNCIGDCDTEGGAATYQTSRFLHGSIERVSDYALVTRRPSPAGETFITLITANHGRTMQGAAEFLVREDKLRDLLEVLVPDDQSAVPEHFQLLLRVEMIDYNEEILDIQYVTHKI